MSPGRCFGLDAAVHSQWSTPIHTQIEGGTFVTLAEGYSESWNSTISATASTASLSAIRRAAADGADSTE